MMFDPADFPYKELSENLRDQYAPDEPHFTNNSSVIPITENSKNLAEMTEQMISNVENQLSLQPNEPSQYFNVENIFSWNTNTTTQNTDLYIVQSDNLLDILDYEPTLLDENTVNQFLLPLPESNVEKKGAEIDGPDLLAIHSCTVCHDIFTTENELLNHTASVHTCTDILQTNHNLIEPIENINPNDNKEDNAVTNNLDFEPEWLICCLCERVLSTALEIEPNEQLCCSNGSGKNSVVCRKLVTMYVCDDCSGLFANCDALDRHKLNCFLQDNNARNCIDLSNSTAEVITEKEQPEICITCDSCGIQHKSTEELKAHAIHCHKPKRNDRRTYSSNSNKMWNCGSCNQLFVTARELYRHKRGEDRAPGAPPMEYICEDCDKVLGSMCALHTHKKMHKVTKPGYPCSICGRRFNQSGHLAIHMRMHTGERPYPCDLCPKAFKVKVERDDHRRTHTGERPFACTACPKTFTAAARLREHARIHTDQRPYRCEICGAAFRRPYARTVHTLIHTGEKPHECDICGTAFRRSGDMWKHKRTLHGIQATNDNETRT